MDWYSVAKDFLLPIIGIYLILFQINQNSLIDRKERVRAVYVSFLSKVLPIMAAKNGEVDSDDKRTINSALGELSLIAPSEILDSLLNLISQQGVKNNFNLGTLTELRLLMRQDLEPKLWEHFPVVSTIVRICFYKKIRLDHVLTIRPPDENN